MLLQDIDFLNTMYPTFGSMVTAAFVQPAHSTLYGYVVEGQAGRWKEGEYFSHPATKETPFNVTGRVFLVCRLGFLGVAVTGHNVEEQGRLSYIDGCSSSLLIYPPRIGDPSLHHLHFPKGTNQSQHQHPSIRVGVVIRGKGVAHHSGGKTDLVPGVVFGLAPLEKHFFTTDDESMDIIAYHPDGDWGPTDENHPMLNRTYVVKRG